jgi:hypothetical protein
VDTEKSRGVHDWMTKTDLLPSRRSVVEAKLDEELQRLKVETGLGYELSVKWAPKLDSDRHGEVLGTVIYIYDESEDGAFLTLRHEFVDYHITKEVIEPLIKYINVQKCLIEDLIYSRKERLVKRFLKLV